MSALEKRHGVAPCRRITTLPVNVEEMAEMEIYEEAVELLHAEGSHAVEAV